MSTWIKEKEDQYLGEKAFKAQMLIPKEIHILFINKIFVKEYIFIMSSVKFNILLICLLISSQIF